MENINLEQLNDFETHLYHVINFLYGRFVNTYYVDEQETYYVKQLLKDKDVRPEVAKEFEKQLTELEEMYIQSVKDNF